MMKLLFASEEPTEPVEDPKSPQLAVDVALSPGSSEPKAPESGGSSDRILSPSWASASTLIEAADAPPPTVGSSETSAEEEAEADANPEAEEAETQTEQPTAEEVLTAEVEMLRDENAQMREQLEKMHTLLQGQMALMSKAAASLTPPPTPKRCPDAPPYTILNRDVLDKKAGWWSSEPVTSRLSVVFSRPTTRLGWITRSAIAAAGIAVAVRHGGPRITTAINAIRDRVQ